MARLKRQELKHDEFIDSADALYLYVEEHGRTLVTAALAVLVAGGALVGFYWYSRQQEHQGNAALGAALMTFEAPVQAGLPPLPGETRKTFTSEQEKYTAAEKEFTAVRTGFPRTRAALFAKHYQALCQWEKGEHDSALAGLDELTRAADPNVAALAKLHLAGYYESLGRAADAEKLYRDLADHPAVTVPRAAALLALAQVVSNRDAAEARRLLEEVKGAYPDTSIATEATRRLELLPATPPADPAPAAAPAAAKP